MLKKLLFYCIPNMGDCMLYIYYGKVGRGKA
jgi:hypothetical protein